MSRPKKPRNTEAFSDPEEPKQESLWDEPLGDWDKLPLPPGGVYTKLRGQTFHAHSQSQLRKMRENGYRKLRVEPELDNVQFPEAIGIWCLTQIGYIDAELAKALQPGVAAGELKLRARAELITGDETKGHHLGCNMALWDEGGTDLKPLHPRMNNGRERPWGQS